MPRLLWSVGCRVLGTRLSARAVILFPPVMLMMYIKIRLLRTFARVVPYMGVALVL